MAITVHVYQIYIAAGAEQVWQAITESDWTTRYFHSTSFVEPPAAGQPFRTVTADGRDAIDGVVEEMEPPVAGRPGRFVQTWHVLYDAAMAAEPPGRVEWTVEQVGDGLTRVRLVHGGLAFSPVTWASVKDGWVWVLDAMKTVIETGTPLPRVSADVSDESPRARESEPPDGTWHRAQGVEATNATWALDRQAGSELRGRGGPAALGLCGRLPLAASGRRHTGQRGACGVPDRQGAADHQAADGIVALRRPVPRHLRRARARRLRPRLRARGASPGPARARPRGRGGSRLVSGHRGDHRR